MKVLVVDDYESTRSLMRRILVRDYSCAVVEATNGVEALAAIATHQFSFVLLDVSMPVMDGIETLQAIRRSSEQPDLPIVMLTVAREDTAVRRIVGLGVTDYLVKPLKADQISERLRRVVAAVSKRRCRRPQVGAVTLERSSLAIIAEGDPDFRHFFHDVLAPHCIVNTAESGAHALKQALDTPPQLVFLGSGLGALDRELFAHKARELAGLKGMSLVAVVPKHDVDSIRQSALFDAVIARTFVPEVFTGQLRRLFHAGGAMTRVLSLHPTLRVNMITAAEQVVGMMLSSEVSVSPPSLEPEPHQGITAEVVMTLEDEKMSLVFELCCGVDEARVLGSALTGTSPEGVSDEDGQAACQEMANMITGRLQAHFRERGIKANCSLPQVAFGTLPPPIVDADHGITVHVESTRGTRFRMSLHGERLPEPDSTASATGAQPAA